MKKFRGSRLCNSGFKNGHTVPRHLLATLCNTAPCDATICQKLHAKFPALCCGEWKRQGRTKKRKKGSNEKSQSHANQKIPGPEHDLLRSRSGMELTKANSKESPTKPCKSESNPGSGQDLLRFGSGMELGRESSKGKRPGSKEKTQNHDCFLVFLPGLFPSLFPFIVLRFKSGNPWA